MTRPCKSTDARTPTAHHEAGHAVLSAAINDRPEHVSIRGHEGTLGRSAQKMLGRPTSLVQVYLAGFAAEHLLTGRRPRSFDVEVGLGLLAHLDPDLVETIEGVEATDGYGAVHQVLRSGVREVEAEVRAEVERLYGVAGESLRAVWPSVKAVAEVLLEREELDRAGLEAAIGGADIFGPVFAVQRAHGLLGLPRLARHSAVAGGGARGSWRGGLALGERQRAGEPLDSGAHTLRTGEVVPRMAGASPGHPARPG